MNEVQVSLDEFGRVQLSRAGYSANGIYTLETTEALRAFFQAERDKELGRWRDPENPDMVVLLHDRGLRVLNERDGHWESWTRKQAKHDWNVEVFGYDTACRYFQEHPEPKPWDMAEEDEIWVLTIDGGVDAWRLNEYGTWTNTSATVCLANPPITAGHRIWPEEDK